MTQQTGTDLGGYGGRALARLLGPLNAWSFALQRLSAQDESSAARRLEELGYGAIWIPESLGSKELIAHASLLLQATDRAILA